MQGFLPPAKAGQTVGCGLAQGRDPEAAEAAASRDFPATERAELKAHHKPRLTLDSRETRGKPWVSALPALTRLAMQRKAVLLAVALLLVLAAFSQVPRLIHALPTVTIKPRMAHIDPLVRTGVKITAITALVSRFTEQLH